MGSEVGLDSLTQADTGGSEEETDRWTVDRNSFRGRCRKSRRDGKESEGPGPLKTTLRL